MAKRSLPIIEFANTEQIEECLKYWVRVLALEDWYIKVGVVSSNGMTREYSAGDVVFQRGMKYAQIHILSKEDMPPDCFIRYCAEETLVHELCHLKLDIHGFYDTESIGGRMMYLETVVDYATHNCVADMARALLYARYPRLTKDWFYEKVKGCVYLP